jgi:glycosyltransferase involved in cell wall biosynthesis
LVDAQDSAALAQHLSYLAANPALAREMGARGRQKLLARYTNTHMGDIVEALYQRVLRHAGT